jgi:hypothetical protein
MRIVPVDEKRYLIEDTMFEVLKALYMHHQLEDGDLPSKNGREYLIAQSLIFQTASHNFWGYALTLEGARAWEYMAAHPQRTRCASGDTEIIMFENEEYLVGVLPPDGDIPDSDVWLLKYTTISTGGGFIPSIQNMGYNAINISHGITHPRFQKALYALRARWESRNLLNQLWVSYIPKTSETH